MAPPALEDDDPRPVFRTAFFAGIAYFALVFAAGFVLGAARVFWLIPVFGEWAGSLIEIPVIVGVSWWVCGRVIRRFALSRRLNARLIMGMVALFLLLLSEFGLAALLFDQAPAAYAAGLSEPLGLIGLAGQIAFGLFPVFRHR